MDVLQFSLFFAAILVAYVLVHLRLAKFETYLKEVTVLRQLNDRLNGVAEAMDRIRIERIVEGLNVLHEDAQDLANRIQRLERSVVQQARVEVPVAAATGRSAQERILAAVEERLFQLGYQKLRILSELSAAHIEDELEIQVECERGMMPYKGKVVARNGAIVDVDVRSVVGMFP